MKKNSKNMYRWFIAGTMLGMAGGMMGHSMSKKSKRSVKRARNKAADFAGHLSREAGQMLGVIGETWADKLR